MIREIFEVLDAIGNSKNKSNVKLNKSRIRSISSYSSNSIFYFPTMVSDQLLPEEVGMVTKMLERSYASFVVACISLMPFHRVSADDKAAIETYLQQFHQNLGIATTNDSNWFVDNKIRPYLSENATDDEAVEAAQNYLYECWQKAKASGEDLVKIIAEEVSLNDMFNEDAVDPKTRAIQSRYHARMNELNTWGFIGEATEEMFDYDDDEYDEEYDLDSDDDFGELNYTIGEEDDDEELEGWDDSYLDEAALKAKDRKELKDSEFGLPKQRKFPLNDEKHVRQAIRMFRHCPEEDRKELAKNIKKAMKKFNMDVKISPKNPLIQYMPGKNKKLSEAVNIDNPVITESADIINEGNVKEAIDSLKFSLESVSDNKILSCSSLTKLRTIESKLNKAKSKYVKYLNRYKKKYEENQKSGSKSKLQITFNKIKISNPKAFMKQYGEYIKIINKKLKLVEKRREQLRKSKGISESADLFGQIEMDNLDYVNRVIDEALTAPDSVTFQYITEAADDEEEEEDYELSPEDKWKLDNTQSRNRREAIKYEMDREVFTKMDMQKANDAIPFFAKATVGFVVEGNRSEEVVNRDVLIGIKAYVHLIPSRELVNNLYNSIINKRKFLKFVKFVSGEEKSLTDLLFGFKELRNDAVNSRSSAGAWSSAFKRRRRISKMSVPYLMKEYTPNGTLVMTKNEVDYIKAEYGLDVMDPGHAKIIMDAEFLLGFVVVDQAEEMLHVTYDGHGYGFQTYTFAMLERERNASDRQMRELYRSLSR